MCKWCHVLYERIKESQSWCLCSHIWGKSALHFLNATRRKIIAKWWNPCNDQNKASKTTDLRSIITTQPAVYRHTTLNSDFPAQSSGPSQKQITNGADAHARGANCRILLWRRDARGGVTNDKRGHVSENWPIAVRTSKLIFIRSTLAIVKYVKLEAYAGGEEI